ncbi:hypothetical protein BH11ACT2_BH11ACT2_15300 [soil metagenome]
MSQLGSGRTAELSNVVGAVPFPSGGSIGSIEGSVQFSVAGTASRSPIAVLSFAHGGGGRAEFTLPSSLSIGKHTIGAAFTPADPVANAAASGSTVVTIAVAPAVTKPPAPGTSSKPSGGRHASTTRLTLAHKKITTRSRLTVHVAVTAAAQVPQGTVRIRDAGHTVKVVTLHHGVASVTLPRLHAGKRHLTATYYGSQVSTASTSVVKSVRVVRRS